jgi:hypothetical protein
VTPDPKERAEQYREIAEELWRLVQHPKTRFESRRDLGVIADQFEQLAERVEAEAD